MGTLSPDDVVVRNLLEKGAASAPDEEFISFEDGSSWTRRQALDAAYEAANALRRLGVQQGDIVGLFLPNGQDYLQAWWGIASLGATLLPVNTSYRGTSLANLLLLGKPSLIVTNTEFGERVGALELDPAPRLIDSEELRGGDTTAPALGRPIGIGDIAVLSLTSGTTGPSKLVKVTYVHVYKGGELFIVQHGRGSDDTYLADLPMFHNAAIYMITASVASGTKLAVRSVPAMTSYWEVARDTGASLSVMVSSMLPFLSSQANRPAEGEHRLRAVMSAPAPHNAGAFLERFHIETIYTTYGSTEIPGPLFGDPRIDEFVPGYCGRVREGFEIRLVDENDTEVGMGEPGELVVRTEEPWWITPGYFGNDAATALAWRNGWFHTGDMMRRDEEGRYFFVDRIKDALRRRGENISSMEVEAEIATHPLVVEVACVPFRDEGSTEDDVKVWIVPVDGQDVDPVDILKYSLGRMPHFMVPRYFEFVKEFPKTPSQRVMKYELRARGNTPGATWDRDEHGYEVTRAGLKDSSAAVDA